jgi:hypothetical protein|tara:strand:+ start:221 stop:478 length:258 start_codon:yes stop_codon:yes gene_type:complete
MKDIKLPEWFDGEIYEEGGKVRNPFSGEEYLLNAKELSMYDFIMGATMVMEMGGAPKGDSMVNDLRKGLEWFRENNNKAYMTLLN